MKNYETVLNYLFSALPMYQRVGASAYKADLKNTRRLLQKINHPETTFKTVHVAGTNGKGSTSHMLASIFQAAGYQTGLYTSPHLKDFRERIKINGSCISKENVVDFVIQNRTAFDEINPSFFEMTVALAFDYFSKEQVDIAIIEVGMGGRLDSTNVIAPELSIITNISKDHTQFLGDTVEKIAQEKAGIIKPKIPVVIGETQVQTRPVFLEKAQQNQSKILFADDCYRLENVKREKQRLFFDACRLEKKTSIPLQCDLTGIYQEKNICTVLTATSVLKNSFNLTEDAIREGLANVVKHTGLMGRWQIIGEKPIIVCDTGHNEDGIKLVLKQIEQTPHRRLHAVFGVVNDKDVTAILTLLPQDAKYYFCKANLPRALNEIDLQNQAKKFNLQGDAFSTVKEAFEYAVKSAYPEDLIWIGGSTFVVADMLL